MQPALPSPKAPLSSSSSKSTARPAVPAFYYGSPFPSAEKVERLGA